jgi:hypothetical protein
VKNTMKVLCALVLFASSASSEEALVVEGLATEGSHLVEGKGTSIRAAEGELVTLKITYRPGSDVEVHEELTLEGGVAQWIPSLAGLALLEAEIASQDGSEPIEQSRMVSVRFDSLFTSGLFVMLAAGLILFGGAFFSIRTLLSDEAE